VELSFHGTFAPWNFRSCGTFVPRERTFQELLLGVTFAPVELSFLGSKRSKNFRSYEIVVPLRTNIPRTFAPNVPKHDMKLAINPTIHCRIGCCADGKYEKSFSNVFEPVERLLVPLNFAWRSAKNLSIICSSDQYSAAFDRVSVPQHHHRNVHYTYLYLHKSGDL